MTVKTEQTAAEEKVTTADKSDAKPSTADVVKQVRERATADSAKADTAAAFKDDAGEGSGEKETKETTKGESTDLYTADELAALPSLVNADMKRVPPELRNTVQAMQRAEQKRLAKLDAAIKAADAKPEKTAKADAEDEELSFTEAEMRDILKSKKGREYLREFLKDEGVELEEVKELSEDRIMNRALNLASGKYPELAKDQSFWQEVVRAIAADDDLTAEFNENLRNSVKLARVIRVAAAEVRADRASKGAETTAKERERLEKDKENVKRAREAEAAKPGSVAAKSGRKPGVNAEGPQETADVIKMVRSQRGYASS